MGLGDDDPEQVLERYCAADFELWTDGRRLNRAALVEHALAVRGRVVGTRVDVHDVVAGGERVAARYTLRAQMRKGKVVATEIGMFGQLAPDGRLRRIDQVTRPHR